MEILVFKRLNFW